MNVVLSFVVIAFIASLLLASAWGTFCAGRKPRKQSEGERLRHRIAVVLEMEKPNKLVVDLGAEPVDACFLKEAFGELVSSGRFSERYLRRRLTILHQDEEVQVQAWKRVEEAQRNAVAKDVEPQEAEYVSSDLRTRSESGLHVCDDIFGASR